MLNQPILLLEGKLILFEITLFGMDNVDRYIPISYAVCVCIISIFFASGLVEASPRNLQVGCRVSVDFWFFVTSIDHAILISTCIVSNRDVDSNREGEAMFRIPRHHDVYLLFSLSSLIALSGICKVMAVVLCLIGLRQKRACTSLKR